MASVADQIKDAIAQLDNAKVKVDMRIVEFDGTPEGITLAEMRNISMAAIPPEYARLRVDTREHLYQVQEQGVMYCYMSSRKSVYVTVVVDPVVDIPVDAFEDEEDEG